MFTLSRLVISNIKMFVRNRQALFFTFFFPIFLMTVLGLINFDRPSKIDVGLVLTGPPNSATAQFVEGLRQVPVFEIHEGIENIEREQLVEDNRAAVFVIPNNLIPGPAEVKVISNAAQPQDAGTAVNILSGMLDKTALQISGAGNLFTVNQETIDTHHLRYIDFLLPGLLAMSIMQMSVFSVAFVFVTFKEKGIMKRLIATPMKPSIFVASNVITRLMVTLIQAFIFILIGVVFFDAQVIGSYWLLAFVAMLGTVMFLGLGFIISSMADTIESVPAIANLLVFPMLFLGGTFFPIESFPNWLQPIAKYLPLSFFSDGLRQVMTRGAGLGEISHDIWWMIGWGVVFIGLATMTFRFEGKRN